MIQTWRFPIILGLSVIFGLPALRDLMLTPDKLFSAGLSYLGALALSWFGVNAVFRLMEHYAHENAHQDRLEELRELAEQEEEAARAAVDQPDTSSPATSGPPAGETPLQGPSSGAPNVEVDRQGTPNISPETAGSTPAMAQDLLMDQAAAGAGV